jgi:hypothetical protein
VNDALRTNPIPSITHGKKPSLQVTRMGEGEGTGQAGFVPGDQGRVSEVHVRPHIYLKHAWWDCGWKYEQWSCYVRASKWVLNPTGLGATPAAAYADWKRQFQ